MGEGHESATVTDTPGPTAECTTTLVDLPPWAMYALHVSNTIRDTLIPAEDVFNPCRSIRSLTG